jgi:pilus assembly protein Flp/PilA
VALLKKLLYADDGQGIAEYGLILALIAIAVIMMVSPLGEKVQVLFVKSGAAMSVVLDKVTK